MFAGDIVITEESIERLHIELGSCMFALER